MKLRELYEAPFDINCYVEIYACGKDETWGMDGKRVSAFYGNDKPEPKYLEREIRYMTIHDNALVIEIEAKDEDKDDLWCKGTKNNGVLFLSSRAKELFGVPCVAHVAMSGKITWYLSPNTWLTESQIWTIRHFSEVKELAWNKKLSSFDLDARIAYLEKDVPDIVEETARRCDVKLKRLQYLLNYYETKSYWPTKEDLS